MKLSVLSWPIKVEKLSSRSGVQAPIVRKVDPTKPKVKRKNTLEVLKQQMGLAVKQEVKDEVGSTITGGPLMKPIVRRAEGNKEKEERKSKTIKKPVTASTTKGEMQHCAICYFKHDRANIFAKHMEIHEGRFNLNVPVNCPVCSVLLPTKHELNPHYAAHHDTENGVCIECGLVTERAALRRHLEYVHFKSLKNKLCPYCGKAFTCKADLDIHVAVIHEKSAESCICDHCGKVLPHKRLLQKHVHSVHIANKRGPFQCPFCEKIFEKSVAWQKHVKVHSSVKPFRCKWCDYRSYNRFNVRLHMRKRHDEGANYGDIVKDGKFDDNVQIAKADVMRYKIGEAK